MPSRTSERRQPFASSLRISNTSFDLPNKRNASYASAEISCGAVTRASASDGFRSTYPNLPGSIGHYSWSRRWYVQRRTVRSWHSICPANSSAVHATFSRNADSTNWIWCGLGMRELCGQRHPASNSFQQKYPQYIFFANCKNESVTTGGFVI